MKAKICPQSRRRDNRRKAAFSIQHKLVTRRELEPKEISQLFSAIDMKRLSDFGIVKLSVLDLDTLYPLQSLELDYKGALGTQTATTLVGYAASRGRDEIVGALLRAGANPCIRCAKTENSDLKIDETLTEDVMACLLKDIPMTYSVWIVNKIATLRKTGLSLLNSGSESNLGGNFQSFGCANCSEWLQEFPVSWPECSNKAIFCELCVWNTFLEDPDHQFVCPCGTCKSTLDPAMKMDGVLTPNDKQEALEKWSRLPLELNGIQKRPRFRSLPIEETYSQYLGSTQSARTEEMWKACTTGKKPRLVSIIREGVNLDELNEYGQSALFVASFYGHVPIVNLLISMGVSVNDIDNSGCTPSIVAAKKGYTLVLDYLKAAQADLSFTGFFGKSANDYISNKGLNAGPTNDLEMKTSVNVLIDFSSTHPGAGSFYADGFFSEDFLMTLDRLSKKLPVAPPSKAACSSRSYYCDSEEFVSSALGKVLGSIKQQLSLDLSTSSAKIPSIAYPHTRFLFYEEAGGSLPAHVDLSRTDPITKVTSTHTFILYLSDCENGGETVLLQHIRCGKQDKSRINSPEEKEQQKKYIEQQQERALRKEQQRQKYGDSTDDKVKREKDKKKYKKTKKNGDPDSGVLARVSPARGRLLVFPHMCPHEGGVVIDLPKKLIRGELY